MHVGSGAGVRARARAGEKSTWGKAGAPEDEGGCMLDVATATRLYLRVHKEACFRMFGGHVGGPPPPMALLGVTVVPYHRAVNVSPST